jgi:hypothetical protein
MRRIDPAELTDKNIHEFLASDAPIELYCISQAPGEFGAIYQYIIDDGRLWFLTIEDDGLFEACINYLKRQGAPVFESVSKLDEYEKKLLAENPIPEGAWNLHEAYSRRLG